MTKTIKRLLPAALAVLLAGCAMQPVDSTTTRYRVALVAKNNRDSEFWDAVFTGAEAAATEYNLQLTITAPDDEEDYAAQNQLIADAVVRDDEQNIIPVGLYGDFNVAGIDHQIQPVNNGVLNDGLQGDLVAEVLRAAFIHCEMVGKLVFVAVFLNLQIRLGVLQLLFDRDQLMPAADADAE